MCQTNDVFVNKMWKSKPKVVCKKCFENVPDASVAESFELDPSHHLSARSHYGNVDVTFDK